MSPVRAREERITTRLEQPLADRIDRDAAARGWSRSEMIRYILNLHYEQDGRA
jgi:hypothetical protein